MIRSVVIAALALALTAGCEKKPKPLEGPPLRVAFGDCTTGASYVSGPKPAPFEEDRLAMHDPRGEVEAPPPEAPEPESEPDGTALALDEGKMGKRDSTRAVGQYQMKKGDEDPELARKQAVEEARKTGVIGTLAEGGQFATITGTTDFSSGLEDRDVAGGMLGAEVGELAGGFGYAGTGGEGTGWGTIGSGRYGTIGHGSGTGSGYGTGAGRGGMRGRQAATPEVRIGNATAVGDLDKNIIRRYIRRKLPQIKYCYEKQLLVNMGLKGTVVTEFTILPNGVPASPKASGVSPEVSTCVALVISSIQFPKPKGGGMVQVRYPFNFMTGDPSGSTGTAESDPPAPPEPAVAKTGAAKAPTRGVLDNPSYVPGQDNPLRTHGAGIEACFRKHRTPHGVAVIDLTFGDGGVVAAASTHGDLGDSLASCVSEAAKKARWESASGSTRRCPVAVGTATIDQPAGRGGGPVPLVDITAEQISFDDTNLTAVAAVVGDTSPTWKIEPLYERAVHERRQHETAHQRGDVVTVTGPGAIRPVGTTPMKVVNQVLASLAASGLEFVLAADRNGTWRFLHDIELPVVPVPRGTGRPWGGKGLARAADLPEEEWVRLSILVAKNEYWVGQSRLNEIERIPRTGAPADLAAVDAALRRIAVTSFRAQATDVEIAAEDDVPYADVVAVIDTAVASGLRDWGIMEPNALSVRFFR